MAAIRLNNREDQIEIVLSSSLMGAVPAEADAPDPLASNTWEEVSPNATLLTPAQCKSLWMQFKADIAYIVNQATSDQEARRQAKKVIKKILGLVALALMTLLSGYWAMGTAANPEVAAAMTNLRQAMADLMKDIGPEVLAILNEELPKALSFLGPQVVAAIMALLTNRTASFQSSSSAAAAAAAVYKKRTGTGCFSFCIRRHFLKMHTCAPPHHFASLKFPELHCSSKLNNLQVLWSFGLSKRNFKVFAVAASSSSSMSEASNYIPAAPIFLPEGPWQQIPGGVTAAKGFKAAGIFGGLRAKGEKPDLALVTCDVDATAAGVFTTNMVAAAPVLYCKNALDISKTARAVLINAGQANAATGDAGYQDVLESAGALAMLLKLKPEEVLIESTGVIGQRIKKEALLNSLPKLVNSLSPSIEGAGSAAVAITTTDLVSKSVAIESKVGGTDIKVGGMAKGSGMIHPNMATMLGVITTDALVNSDVWRKMVQISVNRSFNQITVDGDTSTNDTVIALASGLSGSTSISNINCHEAMQLQACLDAVMQGLAKSIAWDGEGATCLIEVTVTGAESEAKAAKIARSVASSSLVKAGYQNSASSF
ncbi:hypothetical protein OIU84_001315 [Salix udensis]|uniref:Arginine biosynthesis bifunctional protein ArgJ, chloroplastic n=1 Tax=Salix udensis TaxID=889485 RepID=A0AAD6K6K5_9ROSI|nr:hypothetical protein OIU84_001315 [Salix udensis]